MMQFVAVAGEVSAASILKLFALDLACKGYDPPWNELTEGGPLSGDRLRLTNSRTAKICVCDRIEGRECIADLP